MANTLDRVDPAAAWQPAPAEPWDLKWAAHLYRRAAFGTPPREMFGTDTSWQALEQAVAQGRDASIEQLLEGAPGQADFDDLMDSVGANFAKGRGSLDKLQGWWLYRMLHSRHPLRERLTLFWHDHFATSAAKVRQLSLMFHQNRTLRAHALGSFRTLLLEIGRDPAMLVWLDSSSNVKGHPNENYAREVMELFSLGVGNYSEQDIQEAARALTGFSMAGGQFAFQAAQHDSGQKTLFGLTGNWGGDDVVRILLEQPAAARFLVRKLYQEFISESEPPPDRLIEPLADQFRESDYDIQACLATILRSQLFNSEYAYRQRIKSPVEYVVGLLKSFDARVPMEDLADAMDGLGQSLFAPPNVKGWDGGKDWLNSGTLLARHNLAWRLVGGEDNTFMGLFDPSVLFDLFGKKSLTQQVDLLLDMLVQGDVSPPARQKLLDAAANADDKDEDGQNARIRELAHTILLMPEYQLA